VEEEVVEEGAFLVEEADGWGSKMMGNIEDVEAVILPGSDGDGETWTVVVTVSTGGTALGAEVGVSGVKR
jgi:hypothetical protein